MALKSLNKESSEEDKVRFLQEAAIMGQFRHPNVISLHGVMTRGKPVGFNNCGKVKVLSGSVYFVTFAKKKKIEPKSV